MIVVVIIIIMFSINYLSKIFRILTTTSQQDRILKISQCQIHLLDISDAAVVVLL